jgi:transcriptional regulator with XRE-family HTH domain
MTRPHGYARYKLDNCRCYQCAAAVSAYEMARYRAIAYGTWQPFVDATPAREHILRLSECGIGSRRLAELSGVSRSLLTAIVHGKPGREPSRKVRPATAERILRVEPTLCNLAAKTVVASIGTHRRVQALMARGWSQAKIGERLGVAPGNFVALMKSAHVTAATAVKMQAVYSEMWDQDPPESTQRERISVSRSRNYAQARGWLPPAAWDDDLIDLPDADLRARIAELVEAMDDDELRHAYNAVRKLGEASPVIVAAGLKWGRIKAARRAELVAA